MISGSNLPSTLEDGRDILDFNIPSTKKKELGQCFTGLKTGRLLAALSFKKSYKNIIDPMAGHGDLLESVAERAQALEADGINLNGIEIDARAAELCDWRLNACIDRYGVRASRLINDDAFKLATSKKFNHQDLVIANPPYVRYQNRADSGKMEGSASPSSSVRLNLKSIAKQFAPDRELHLWNQIIDSYSGVSDLSIPSWILSGLMVAPGGTLALVVPQVWLNRDYARIARYTLLRFFRPRAIIQESGQRWFKDALVPVSLVVASRLDTDETIIPLGERYHCSNEETTLIEIAPNAASSESHVGGCFPEHDPEGAFANWLESGSTGKKDGISISRITYGRQCSEILAAAEHSSWLNLLELKTPTSTEKRTASLSLPWSAVEHLPSNLLGNVTHLASGTVSIGQGLRTGCNPFFYVNALDGDSRNGNIHVQTDEIFGKRILSVPSIMLRPVLRKQGEVENVRITPKALRTRLLDLRGWFLPEDVTSSAAQRELKERILPDSIAEHVRNAARSYIHRGEKRTLIPELSAVRTNGLRPGAVIEDNLLLADQSLRMWYMIPDIKARHEGSICVPRIINSAPKLYFNSAPPSLVDANFSTIWVEKSNICNRALYAFLNSSWAMFCYEAIGATLGGGALKLEATHLRRLPMPQFTEEQSSKLAMHANTMLSDTDLERSATCLRDEVDHIVIQALCRKRTNKAEVSKIRKTLTDLTEQMRNKRARK